MRKTENFYLATIFNVKHLKSSYISIYFAEGLGCQKIQVSAFRCHLGCTPYAPNWVFFSSNLWNWTFLLLYYSARKKATSTVFIWGDKGYPAVRFEFKTASEQYLVAEIQAKQFWVFFEKNEVLNFSKKKQNSFAYISEGWDVDKHWNSMNYNI